MVFCGVWTKVDDGNGEILTPGSHLTNLFAIGLEKKPLQMGVVEDCFYYHLCFVGGVEKVFLLENTWFNCH